jgi:adenylate cyclase
LGKQTAVTLYTPILESELPQAELIAQFLAMYRSLDFIHAELALNTLNNKILVQLYQERIAGHRLSPPAADWDGVYGFDRK